MLFWELSESEELPDPLDEDDDDPEDEDDEEELEPEVLPPGRAFGGIVTRFYSRKIMWILFKSDIS